MTSRGHLATHINVIQHTAMAGPAWVPPAPRNNLRSNHCPRCDDHAIPHCIQGIHSPLLDAMPADRTVPLPHTTLLFLCCTVLQCPLPALFPRGNGQHYGEMIRPVYTHFEALPLHGSRARAVERGAAGLALSPRAAQLPQPRVCLARHQHIAHSVLWLCHARLRCMRSHPALASTSSTRRARRSLLGATGPTLCQGLLAAPLMHGHGVCSLDEYII